MRSPIASRANVPGSGTRQPPRLTAHADVAREANDAPPAARIEDHGTAPPTVKLVPSSMALEFATYIVPASTFVPPL